jgi:hypothetical protein
MRKELFMKKRKKDLIVFNKKLLDSVDIEFF